MSIKEPKKIALSPFRDSGYKSITDNNIFRFLSNIHPYARKYIASVSVPPHEFPLMLKSINHLMVFSHEYANSFPQFMGFYLLLSDDNEFHINYKPEYALDIAAMSGCADKYWKEEDRRIRDEH